MEVYRKETSYADALLEGDYLWLDRWVCPRRVPDMN